MLNTKNLFSKFSKTLLFISFFLQTEVKAETLANYSFFRGYNLVGEPVVIAGDKWLGKSKDTPIIWQDSVISTINVTPINPELTEIYKNGIVNDKGTKFVITDVCPGMFSLELFTGEPADSGKQAGSYSIFINNEIVFEDVISPASGNVKQVGPFLFKNPKLDVLYIKLSRDIIIGGIRLKRIGGACSFNVVPPTSIATQVAIPTVIIPTAIPITPIPITTPIPTAPVAITPIPTVVNTISVTPTIQVIPTKAPTVKPTRTPDPTGFDVDLSHFLERYYRIRSRFFANIKPKYRNSLFELSFNTYVFFKGCESIEKYSLSCPEPIDIEDIVKLTVSFRNTVNVMKSDRNLLPVSYARIIRNIANFQRYIIVANEKRARRFYRKLRRSLIKSNVMIAKPPVVLPTISPTVAPTPIKVTE
jgi:hypothetical protein